MYKYRSETLGFAGSSSRIVVSLSAARQPIAALCFFERMQTISPELNTRQKAMFKVRVLYRAEF
ncbi:MAG: hypothetical protein ACI9I0_000025 [Rhodoferax sp.]